ncbi:MAG: TIGR04372 family glycosyltransferase [Burkholderiales bacterium]
MRIKGKALLWRMRIAYVRATREGTWWTIREILRRGLMWMGWTTLLPATLVVHLLGYRRLPVFTHRIGHLAAEPDCFLKKVRLGQIKGDEKKYFLLAPPAKVANRCLLGYWRNHFAIVSNPVLCLILEIMSYGFLLRNEVSSYVLSIGDSAEYFSINSDWGTRPPVLQFEASEKSKMELALRRLGMPDHAWFVCVHAREGGYSPTDEAVHSYRNMDIDTYVPGMLEIVRRGGWCIRMGDPSMKRLPPMHGVIDYAHDPIRSPELDVFFCAQCRFFLGNTSGLFILSSIFGVPAALANMVPFASMGFCRDDLSIPKLIRSKYDQRLLTIDEILGTPVANYRIGGEFEKSGLELLENTAEDILGLVVEMLDRLEGKKNLDANMRSAQSRFRSKLRYGDYCYGASSNIAARFLASHREVFASLE